VLGEDDISLSAMICAGRFQVIVALAFINARAFSVEIACESGTCECAVTTFGSVFCMKTIHVSFSSVDLLHLLTHPRSTLLLYLYYKVIKAKTNDQAAILKNILKQIKYSQYIDVKRPLQFWPLCKQHSHCITVFL